jgi:integrase
MKMGQPHRVPLSERALDIISSLNETRVSEFVFPGQKAGRPMSNMAYAMLMRRHNLGHCTVHGFRSSFRDWVGDETRFPREIAEHALAHQVGSEVERAYRRSDALEKRRKLMETWAEFCANANEEHSDD